MDEILPGILHWTTFHEGIGQTVHSHIHAPSGAIFDPRLPPTGGLEVLSHTTVPSVVLLSSRHHVRNSASVADAYEIPIKVSRPGLADVRHSDAGESEVGTFGYEEQVVPGVTTHELRALAPDETVFQLESADEAFPDALLFGDSLVSSGGELHFMPDELLGDDPEAVIRGLAEGLQKILDEASPFDALLFAHGTPVASGGREMLQQFIETQH